MNNKFESYQSDNQFSLDEFEQDIADNIDIILTDHRHNNTALSRYNLDYITEQIATAEIAGHINYSQSLEYVAKINQSLDYQSNQPSPPTLEQAQPLLAQFQPGMPVIFHNTILARPEQYYHAITADQPYLQTNISSSHDNHGLDAEATICLPVYTSDEGAIDYLYFDLSQRNSYLEAVDTAIGEENIKKYLNALQNFYRTPHHQEVRSLSYRQFQPRIKLNT